ncbi:hypothetical protein EVAR_84332_1 [Eumeta japonica]|uniref:Uncharacterized protein n=1 Tax=Eumeta variegata TaxID=151549 RepID=A0A4C1U4J0_EUMVA|nr:hypothetical protein EVAR_84332_1 [Eumeta japonica]
MEKLKGGIFDGPQIRQLMKDTDFIKVMTVPESDAWESFVLVVENFLGNQKAPNYEEIVQNMLTNFQTLGANMSIKLHYLHNHLDKFPDNLGNYSEEQGERFHQDLKVMEESWVYLEIGSSRVNPQSNNYTLYLVIIRGTKAFPYCSPFDLIVLLKKAGEYLKHHRSLYLPTPGDDRLKSGQDSVRVGWDRFTIDVIAGARALAEDKVFRA